MILFKSVAFATLFFIHLTKDLSKYYNVIKNLLLGENAMPNYMDYVKNYGHISFLDKPFGDADNITLCGMYYMPFEQVVSDDFDAEPISFAEASNKLFALRGYKHKPVGLVLQKNISELMMLMTEYKRFQEMKMVACVNVFEKNPDVQFNACTFILPDGTLVVVFRGTDDSLRGWKEDFDILVKDSIPSQKLATDYLEKLAEKYDGDIIVCGHSKGGYVAQYGALYCKQDVKDRIKLLYNNDGPGFSDYSYLFTEAYKELLPRYKHFVPQSSLIGMMLCHDDDYIVVKSNRVTGPMEHDLVSWQFDGDQVKTVDDLTRLGKVNDTALFKLVQGLSNDQKKAFDEVLTANLEGTGQVGLLDVKDNVIDSIKGMKIAKDATDESSQKEVKGILISFLETIVKSIKEVGNGDFKTVQERIEEE